MRKGILASLAVVTALALAACSSDSDTSAEESAPETAVGTIVEVATGAGGFDTLVAAVIAADLVDTLNSAGPFTVFAPTNAAFDKLPKGTVETLVKPENKATLQAILTYHVVAGKMNASAISKAIEKGNGKAVLTTVQGGKLTAWMMGADLYITDENGNKAKVTIADVNQSNGVIHVIDAVVTPKA